MSGVSVFIFSILVTGFAVLCLWFMGLSPNGELVDSLLRFTSVCEFDVLFITCGCFCFDIVIGIDV